MRTKTPVRKKIKTEVDTQYGRYAVVLEREPDMGGYMVEAPGVQGAISWGKTVSHAEKMIKEAIELVVETRAVMNAEKQGFVRILRRAKPELVT